VADASLARGVRGGAARRDGPANLQLLTVRRRLERLAAESINAALAHDHAIALHAQS